ncbi:PepSY domain-containing protein [Gammaproteobacteria bacterium]|nr:PepSY domain-containing protein [Gammaproteobacteria bacterium]
MKVKKFTRNLHRYLSIFVSIQLLLWTISGIYFAYNKIELVRGEQYRLPKNVEYRIFDRLGISIIETTEYGEKSYKTYPDGNLIKPLTKEEAIKITAQKTTLNPLEVSLVTELYPGAEYRGSLPVYKVKTDTKDDINVYVGYMTGDIGSIRSDSWRIWDLMWSLHIMDYRERDNINNILLQILSILALVTSISGITLFFVKK